MTPLFKGRGVRHSSLRAAVSLTLTLRALGAATTLVPSATQGTPADAPTPDDTLAVQRAVDGGGTVRFSDGTYRLLRPVMIDLERAGFTSLIGEGAARIVMAGPGPAFKFVGNHEGTADPATVKSNIWARQRMPMVTGLEITGAHVDADGIELTGTMQATITQVALRDLRHGIHLTGRNRNIIISNCHIYHNRGVGIFYDHVNLHQSNIVGSHISYCAGGGIVALGGSVYNIQVAGSDLEENMAEGSPDTANILIDCEDGFVGEVAISGCTIQHGRQPSNSANIRVTARNTGTITLSGNVISDVQVNVHLKRVRNAVITGNLFEFGYEHDLLVEDSSNILVGPNTFDRTPQHISSITKNAKGGIVFRDSRDCTINGIHMDSIWRQPAAILLERCNRFSVTDCTILDCDEVGLLLRNVTDTRVSGCTIRDDRAGSTSLGLKILGGRDNWVLQNFIGNGTEAEAGAAILEGNRGKSDPPGARGSPRESGFKKR